MTLYTSLLYHLPKVSHIVFLTEMILQLSVPPFASLYSWHQVLWVAMVCVAWSGALRAIWNMETSLSTNENKKLYHVI